MSPSDDEISLLVKFKSPFDSKIQVLLSLED